MKHIWLICSDNRTGQYLTQQLHDVLGDAARIRTLSLREEPLPASIDADLVLLTARRMARAVSGAVTPRTPVLTTIRTLLRKDWQELMALPAGARLLVVDEEEVSATLNVVMLAELGVNHVQLLPWSPGQPSEPDVDLAITFGQGHAVPRWARQVRDFGPRPIDPVTLNDVLTVLGLTDPGPRQRLQEWLGRAVTRHPGLAGAVGALGDLTQFIETVLDFSSDAVVGTDAAGRITLFSRRAEALFQLPASEALGRPARTLLPGDGLDQVLAGQSLPPDQPVTVAGTVVDMTCLPLRQSGRVTGTATLLRLPPEPGPGGARTAARKRGQPARYTFADFVGQSPQLKRVIARARQIARSASTVLILGETGTGKEMLAQAIHNASPRQKGPFVAVNCAALPESLVESELFGYEEGAFTGAVRGGRQGLFEQADGGTIFLDEIGDISPSVQARLLRVLEERQVLRVGGSRVIPLDVRVIAATNQDLADLVARGRFRADLYYRLNVLSLKLPPLRQRPEDIPLLVQHYLAQQGYHGPVAPEVLAALTRYSWPGNLRELRNCVEHMATVAVGPIGLDDLPTTVLGAGHVPAPAEPPLSPQREKLIMLRILADADKAGERVGRGAVRRRLAEQGIHLTEAEVRSRLAQLTAEGLVVAGRGRQGSRLSPAGWALVRQGG